jgi:putative DNA methylase
MLALRENGKKAYLAARKEDHALYAEAKTRLDGENLPLPTQAVRPGHNTDQARGYNYNYWRDFFNARQLLCLGMLLRAILEIDDEAIQEQMLCLFSSTLEFNNLFCSFKGEGTGAVRHMFSNHILKPERAPLENSVWGTEKSSGTFSTLFASRLIPAKRYLDEPFELRFDHDLLGAKAAMRKTVASDPVDAVRVDTWQELVAVDRAVMILNGDSAQLPLPDASVDAVVTDPPYFDFVHYSELSDFFYAWLSPVLSQRYPWMNQADSSHQSEVQHKDSRKFALQLSRVFSECRRVLKDDGVLAFSFHHSRAEGWAAIYQAIETAGLAVVAAHPVHAELRASSPKTAAKNPISLDAILVCKKRRPSLRPTAERLPLAVHVDRTARSLESAGLRVSRSDRFVIGASQFLIEAGHEVLSFEDARDRIEGLRQQLGADAIEEEPVDRLASRASGNAIVQPVGAEDAASTA